jgi:uncharacterized protein YbaR (Trm112 family)
MNISTLEILRCPFCGGRLDLVTSLFNRTDGDEIHDGILGCACCTFPVIAGIPVLHLLPPTETARSQVEAGRPDLALLTMARLEEAEQAARFEEVAGSDTATYAEIVEALGPNFEGGYFLYRFSDPTFIVARAVVRAVAGTVLHGKRRAIDVCGGSGHLTRSLLDLSSPAPVLADLFFPKIWLARRFTAPGCEAVCCDGNAPLPFARGAFGFAMCSDAFMYIWLKRQFIGEMTRLVEGPSGDPEADGEPGAVLISHTHNERVWSPSHGNPLTPEGYHDLFETVAPRMFGEAGLLADVVSGGPLNLARHDSVETLDADPALTIVASRHPRVFRPHALEPPRPGEPCAPGGEYRISPLYVAEPEGSLVRLRLRFPTMDYEEEYGACRQYLPEEAVVERAALAAMADGELSPTLAELARRHVILDLPKRYY